MAGVYRTVYWRRRLKIPQPRRVGTALENLKALPVDAQIPLTLCRFAGSSYFSNMPSHIPALEIREEPFTELQRHITIPNRFETWSVLDIRDANSGFELRERRRDPIFRKDYDSIENPLEWPKRFDVSNWSLIGAFDVTGRVGGAICAFDTPDIDMLEGRSDLAAMWDLRVSPAAQRRGVGSALFRAVEAWASAKHCKEVKVETQNVNVAACRFYAKQGCQLRQVNYHAYPDLPDEVQLIWRKVISG